MALIAVIIHQIYFIVSGLFNNIAIAKRYGLLYVVTREWKLFSAECDTHKTSADSTYNVWQLATYRIWVPFLNKFQSHGPRNGFREWKQQLSDGDANAIADISCLIGSSALLRRKGTSLC
jgi:hypothetical protein